MNITQHRLSFMYNRIDNHSNHILVYFLSAPGGLDVELTNCALAECAAALTNLQNLDVEQIAPNLEDTTVAQAAVQKGITDDVNKTVTELIANLDDVREQIDTDISGYVDTVIDELESVENDINDTLSDVKKMFQDVNLEDVAESVDDVGDTVGEYADYVGYVLYGFSSLMLLVVLLWIIGALLGKKFHYYFFTIKELPAV